MLVVRVLLGEPDLVPEAEPVTEEVEPVAVVPDADVLELAEVLSSVAAAVSLADAVGLAS